MGAAEEAAVRKLWAEMDCEQWDAAQIDRVLDCLAPNIRYHVYAWEHPVAGRDAVREELLRQAPLFHGLHSEILALASQDNTVFMERRDSMMIGRRPLTQHCAAVFEVDAQGKVSVWRDYYDSKEIAVQLGRDVTTAGTRGYDT
jgi:limonene-1,2-epoxide hydrolase